MSAPPRIIELVKEFEENESYYKDETVFDEENTKVKFLNPFLEALGWNVRNVGLAPWEREVIFEASIKDGKKNRAPDYAFLIDGETIFFLEAKKPSRDIVKDKSHAYQVRRYGWSANLPLCILTDFEELAIYDTRIKPEKNHSATIGRVKYYNYKEYVEKWDEIYNIFSKEAVLNGKFEEFAGKVKEPGKGETEVDDEFIKDIEKWRLDLARNIAIRNPDLNIDALNYAVQLTIDRIIFLRIAEDRKFEPYGRLLRLTEKPDIYKNFAKICIEADQKYNSGLFHFSDYDKEDYTTDIYTLDLNIDDTVFKKIFKNLYYPDSPYEFSVISTEILGKVYEQFLGNIIRLTDGHHAKVEEKPEVKKAGGVYYTPQYIVDYIVKNTVGEKIKGKTPNQISKIKIIDPACGSGSFLIRAYDYLLKFHLKYYLQLEKKPKNVVYQLKDGQYRLTIEEKKRILKNNIYGVDIDTLAVEVTKLSLLLKVLEDQNKEKVEQQQKLFHERALPNLSNNIKNGNSLIESDILEHELTMDEIKEIKPFDWKDEFYEVFKEGGFDCVIGNPPYVGEKGNKDIFRHIKSTQWGLKYYKRKMDEFYFFFHKSFDIIKEKGFFGMITTNYFITADSGIKLRTDIKNRMNITSLINLNELSVFETAKGQHNLITILNRDTKLKNTEASLIFTNKKGNSSEKIFKKIINGTDEETIYTNLSLKNIFETEKNYIRIPKNEEIVNDILKKILSESEKLGKIKKVSQGLISGADKVTQRHLNNLNLKNIDKGEGIYVLNSEEINKLQLNDEERKILKPFFKNSDIDHYYSKKETEKYILYLTRDLNLNKLPHIKEHMRKYSKIVKNRSQERGEMKAALKLGKWWVIFAARKDTNFDGEKIIVPQRSTENKFGYNTIPWYASADVYYITNIEDNDEFPLKYILTLLNSKLYYVWLSNKGKMKGKQLELYYTPLTEIPIKKADEKVKKILVNDAEKIMDLKEKYSLSHTPTERKLIKKQIETIDKEINKTIYELYDLTEDEIEFIEQTI